MSRILKAALILGVAGVALLLIRPVREAALPPLANWLVGADDPDCTTYVMILPGDEIRRPLQAAALVRQGLARDVLIPQNPESPDIRDGITERTAQISRRVLVHRGIPIDRIVLLRSQSRTTFDDAQALSGYLKDHEGTVAIVTSAFHTRRARFIFRKVLGPMAERTSVVAAPNPGFSNDRWWQSREGMRLVLTEYVKLGFYYVRYAGGGWWAAAGLVMAVLVARKTRRRPQAEVMED